MRVETVSLPSKTAILLDEIKDHLRIDCADEDAALGALSATATTLVEIYLDLMLVERPVIIYLDHWFAEPGPAGTELWWDGLADGNMNGCWRSLPHCSLPVKPLRSVEKIEIKAATGEQIEWGSHNYYLKPGLAPVLVRERGRAWPVPSAGADGIKISATAGFGPDWNHVPASIRQALLMLVAHLYYNRGDTAEGSPLKESGASALLATYRGARL
ncbi:MAG: head-tail connector protein [Kordiimonas sp.]